MLFNDTMLERMENVKADLAALRQLSSNKKLEAGLHALEIDLDRFLDACEERVTQQEEREQSARDLFDLRHRQLVGLSEELGALSRKRPEQPCRTFKAQQVNLVLRPLREEMEKELELPPDLVDEDGGHSYSDVSLLVRTYLDLSAVYARRRYDLRYYEKVR